MFSDIKYLKKMRMKNHELLVSGLITMIGGSLDMYYRQTGIELNFSQKQKIYTTIIVFFTHEFRLALQTSSTELKAIEKFRDNFNKKYRYIDLEMFPFNLGYRTFTLALVELYWSQEEELLYENKPFPVTQSERLGYFYKHVLFHSLSMFLVIDKDACLISSAITEREFINN